MNSIYRRFGTHYSLQFVDLTPFEIVFILCIPFLSSTSISNIYAKGVPSSSVQSNFVFYEYSYSQWRIFWGQLRPRWNCRGLGIKTSMLLVVLVNLMWFPWESIVLGEREWCGGVSWNIASGQFLRHCEIGLNLTLVEFFAPTFLEDTTDGCSVFFIYWCIVFDCNEDFSEDFDDMRTCYRYDSVWNHAIVGCGFVILVLTAVLEAILCHDNQFLRIKRG